MRVLGLVVAVWAGAAQADVNAVIRVADASFDRLPRVEIVDAITDCGAGEGVNEAVAYCTTRDVIYLTRAAAGEAEAPYLLAHVYGHAVQVKHGVADVALQTIRANRGREAALRRDVTRMVECIAGVILRNEPPVSLTALFSKEPFTESHWGRDPLTAGPKVTLGLEERAAWLARGQAAGHPSACNTESFPADLVVAAFRG